ncbi:MAG: methionine adenosyltransferase [Verrucomicrobiota bacterium]|jgi:S-adenosylmethionine synthetase|nr:methionine adenosyltransferase [Verrucomicrobiota bacterium]MDD8044913.1 methionine adenosyltransferase [Verrucomicrobiota bacterium]MDD8051396.1 methionine adenosyltransferase [Verrucomicrobiota bacterium]MDI9383453.1 methionine adenosyltransferase [Verrucomicrobiota bacterium]HCF96566.1 methionine adenosyltransferase [Verrucomicrobiota bacterium]
MAELHLFTSESVTEGHPDKVADCLSDTVLDALLMQDPRSRVACESLVQTGLALISGEITTRAQVDYTELIRAAIEEIGYTSAASGFDARSCAVMICLDRQSPDIAMGVTEGEGLHKEQGAGDQGLMFGFACEETEDLMPLPITLAHQLTRRLASLRKEGVLPWLRPDGKSQVTIEYDGFQPVAIDTVVVSTQHDPELTHAEIERAVIEKVILPTLPGNLVTSRTRYLVNPTGRFVVGGPQGDCGLTGRKIIVDTYGGMSRHGGGAFSGKDPSKVDRSASYMARYIAKNIVAAGLAKRCEVQLAYAIGYAEPVSLLVETFGTATVPESRITAAVRKLFGLRPAEIIQELDLLRPIYRSTSAYGHFGRKPVDGFFTWEKIDRIEALREAVQ